MQNITITKARESLPKLAEAVYFQGKTFIITKRGIPMAEVRKPQKLKKVKKYTLKDRKRAIKEVAGIWKNRWKGMSTEKVVEMLWEKGWNSHAS